MSRPAIAVLMILVPGCASFSTHMTPRPTAPGKFEINGNVDVFAFTDDDGERAILPNVEMMFRYGLIDTADIGAKLNAIGLELNSRVAIVLSDGFDLGVIPSAGIMLRSDATGHQQNRVLSFGLPILAGIHTSESLTVIFGPKFHTHLSTSPTKIDGADLISHASGEIVFYPGGIIGLEVMLSDHFSLFPELNFMFPYLLDYEKFGRPVWQGGVAFQFRFAS